jgi:hypothetical protein
MDTEVFQPATAQGKLNAEMIPTYDKKCNNNIRGFRFLG